MSTTFRTTTFIRWRLIAAFSFLFISAAWVQASEVFTDLNQPADWQPAHDVDALKMNNGVLTFDTTDLDPYIVSRPLRFSAEKYQAIVIEMSVDAGSQGQVFWSPEEPPRFSEPKSIPFPLQADGALHTYTLALSKQAQWRGEISRLRLDPTDTQATVQLRSLKIIERIGPRFEPVFIQLNKPFAQPGETITLQGRFRNTGDENGALIVYTYLTNDEDEALNTEFRLAIPAEEEATFRWPLELDAAGLYTVQSRWQSADGPIAEVASQTTLLQVSKLTDPHHVETLHGDDWRAEFYQTQLGIGPVRFVVDGMEMGWLARLATVTYQTEDGTAHTRALFADKTETTQAGLRFQTQWVDEDRRKWQFKLTVEKVKPEQTKTPRSALRFQYELSGGGSVLNFTGPELFAGERSFGRSKDMSLLGGVEYLDAGAVSSSSRAAHPPVRDQYAPHPHKITVPVMALTHKGRMLSLLWPDQQSRGSEAPPLSPLFSVPNRYYGQENHLLGLFLPPVPNYTHENQTIAHKPYEIAEDRPLTIESVIYPTVSDNPIAAVQAWLDFYQKGELPQPAPPPRRYAQEIALSRQAYLVSCWDEDAKGWGHAVGWQAQPSGGILALLALDQYLNQDPKVDQTLRQRIELVKASMLKKQGLRALGEATGCHVMLFEPAFFWGVTEHSLPNWQNRAWRLIETQNDDGSWGFHPSSESQRELGEAGSVVSGTIAPNAMFLLRLARITGDATTTEAGLRGVQALNRRRVPRGSQHWEVPLTAPDILVSGYGARANVDAYRLTGDDRYLQQAVYWAQSGLPFHYLWNLRERPLQRYATIPVFGATFYTHSWLMTPVQWCGLVYAYHVLELAEFDSSMNWRRIARGIVNSAMHQQMAEGRYIGTLPDSYADSFTTPRPAYINPENIMTPLHALEGNSLNFQTHFVGEPAPQGLRINANAQIKVLQHDDSSFTYKLRQDPGRVTESVISPMASAPKAVRINGELIEHYEQSLYGIDQGWRYNSAQQCVYIHTPHQSEWVEIKVEMQ